MTTLPAQPALIFLETAGTPPQKWGARDVPAIPACQQPANQIAAIVAQWLKPFNVNVTLSDPGGWNLDGSQPFRPQLRVVIGGTWNWYGVLEGGAAVIGCYADQSQGNSVYVFSDTLGSVENIAFDCLHEIGHAAGLQHQSDFANGQLVNAYKPGAIMGNPFIAPLLGWISGTNVLNQPQNDRMVMGKLWGGSKPGDLNFDGAVNEADEMALRAGWGTIYSGVDALAVGRNVGK